MSLNILVITLLDINSWILSRQKFFIIYSQPSADIKVSIYQKHINGFIVYNI